MTDLFTSVPLALRVLAIGGLAAGAHGIVKGLRWASEWALTPRGEQRKTIATRYPRVATVLTILVSALTFSIYFSALGFIFHEFGISLTAYFASASVVGLAVGFGSQGLVQDVVTGVTLIFSYVLNVGDVVDISGQTGRVEGVGLRFTQLSNLHEQSVFIPNRNITQINRYRNGYVRAYVDVQVPEGGDADTVVEVVETLAGQMHGAHQAIIRSEPDSMGICAATPEGWRYARVKFHLWPGQGGTDRNGLPPAPSCCAAGKPSRLRRVDDHCDLQGRRLSGVLATRRALAGRDGLFDSTVRRICGVIFFEKGWEVLRELWRIRLSVHQKEAERRAS